MKNRSWIERLHDHDPTKRGFIFGRDHPDQAFNTPEQLLPANYDYMARWERWLQLVRNNLGEPKADDGLSPEQVDVLMNSEDTRRRLTVTIFGQEYTYHAQYARNTQVVKFLQSIGLTYIVEYKGGNILDPADGLPLGLKGCVWGWTPIGIKWVRQRMGIQDEQHIPRLFLQPTIVDRNRYG